MNIRSLILVAVVAALLAACGVFGDKNPEYYDVPESKTLEVPQDLDRPNSATALTVDRQYMTLPERELSPVPPRVLANQKGNETTTRMKWSADGVYLLVQDSPESVQRRLKFVIERSGMQLHNQSADGNYRFSFEHVRSEEDTGFFSKIAFWRDDAPDYSGEYQTVPQPDGTDTRVYLKYADGGEVPMDAAEHVLVILMERLG